MARITSQKAKQVYQGSQFEMILAGSQRAREIKNGSIPKLPSRNGPVVTAIREIEEGLYTREDFMKSFGKRNKK